MSKFIVIYAIICITTLAPNSCQDIDDPGYKNVPELDISASKKLLENRTVEVATQWETYYGCQKEQYQQMFFRKSSVETAAIAVFEGAILRLPCNVCLSPTQRESEITWHFKGGEMKPLNKTGHNLVFNNIFPGQSGEYFCKLNGMIRAAYIVQVLYQPFEPMQQVKPHNGSIMQNDTVLTTSLGTIKLYSAWGEWSNCSESHHCGRVGRRVKYGPCMLALIGDILDNKQAKQMSHFEKGLPCRSPFVPAMISNMDEVKNRPSEIMLGFCKVSCRNKPTEKFKVVDKDGKVVDTVDNKKGIFSSLQGLPKLPPLPRRVYLFPYKGTKLVVKCPGEKISDSPVQWKSGYVPLNRKEIRTLTMERVTINILNQIQFKELHVKDTSIYSCWQEGVLIGIVNVKVMQQDIILSNVSWSLFLSGSIVLCMLWAVYAIYRRT